jgi:hypothetical protein
MVVLFSLMVNLKPLINLIYGGVTIGTTEMYSQLITDIPPKINHIESMFMVVKDVVMEDMTLDGILIPENHSLDVKTFKL